MGIDNTWSGSGNVGSDPELRFTDGGVAVASFSVALYEGKDKNGDPKPPSWIDVTAFDGLAENVAESLSKGLRVTVVGRVSQDRWETADGDKRSKIKIIADDVAVSLKWASATVNRNERDNTEGGKKQRPAPQRKPSRSASVVDPVYAPGEEPF